jgi:hypothetical protein
MKRVNFFKFFCMFFAGLIIGMCTSCNKTEVVDDVNSNDKKSLNIL